MDNKSLFELFTNATSGVNTSVNASEIDGGGITLAQFLDHHAQACAQLKFDQVVGFVVPVIFAIIVVVGVIGNLLVLAVVLFGQQMRNTTNVLILVGLKTFKLSNKQQFCATVLPYSSMDFKMPLSRFINDYYNLKLLVVT